MSPKDHIIFGTAGAAALYPAMGANALIFWAASFAIDIDHYLDFIYHNGFKDFGIKSMFDYHNALNMFWRRPEFLNVEIFHTVEFIAPLFWYAHHIGSQPLMALTLGLIFHCVLDMIFLARQGVFFIRAYSFTEYFIRKKMIEAQGFDTESIYNDAFLMMREGRLKTGR